MIYHTIDHSSSGDNSLIRSIQQEKVRVFFQKFERFFFILFFGIKVHLKDYGAII